METRKTTAQQKEEKLEKVRKDYPVGSKVKAYKYNEVFEVLRHTKSEMFMGIAVDGKKKALNLNFFDAPTKEEIAKFDKDKK